MKKNLEPYKSPANFLRSAAGLAVLSVSSLIAQSTAPPAQPNSVTLTAVAAPSRARPSMMPRRAAAYYEMVWGVDSLDVKVVESGELIRFTYRVLDPAKSAPLNDKKLTPSLIFPTGHIKLTIPLLEQVGLLRQSSTPAAGKSYWMAFSNPGRRVKRGDRVDIEIGSFHAEGLTVN